MAKGLHILVVGMMLLTPLLIFADAGRITSPLTQYNSLPANPITVHVRSTLVDIIEINELEELLTVKLNMELRWRDARLAYDPKQAGTQIKLYEGQYDIDEVYSNWRPDLVFSNSADKVISSQKLAVEPDGTVHYAEIFLLTVEHHMDLTYYPFDKQVLNIYTNLLGLKTHPIQLKVESKPSIFFSPVSGKVDIAQWNFSNLTSSVIKSKKQQNFQYYRLQLVVEREPMHVVLRIYFPIMVFTLLSFIIFWVRPKLMVERVNLSLIGLLSVVTYQIIVQDYLPPVPEIIPIDLFVYLSFIYFFANIAISLVNKHLLTRRKMAQIMAIDRFCRYVFPTSYFLSSITILLYCVFHAKWLLH